MPRKKKSRRIHMAPHFGGFNPTGTQRKSNSKLHITYDEYEALNLCDYELLTQAEAAEMMQVSRPTFTRIYESMRRKLAKAFIEGHAIRFEGGNVEIANWYKCDACQISFTIIEKQSKTCPLCAGSSISKNT